MNTLYKMTKEEFEKKKILYKFNDVKYIVMDGAGIETYEQYFDKLWEVFGFSEIPEGWKKDYHTEYDFMTDDDFLPFEKYTFVIKNYDEFLRSVYGDYLKMPPKEKRVNHSAMKIDFGDEDVKKTNLS